MQCARGHAYSFPNVLATATSNTHLSAPTVPPPPATPLAQPTVSASTCKATEWPISVLRSTDHGATWTSLSACIPDIGTVVPADWTPLLIDGRIILYFVNFMALEKGILYSVRSLDGVNFDKPQPVYDNLGSMMDPFVLRMPDGSFRMYAAAEPEGIISAASSNGLNFIKEGAIRLSTSGALDFLLGGMPGALVTPDNRIRLFLDGGLNSQGIVSLISNEGLNFTLEGGVRIPKPPDYFSINNLEPIRLKDGSYLMLYSAQDKKHEGRPEWMAEIHVATSMDGLNWNANPTVIGFGGTACVVEAADGTLFIYY